MRTWSAFGLLLNVAITLSFAQSVTTAPQPSYSATGTEGTVPSATQGSSPQYLPVHKFDPKRDANADVQLAIAEAHRTNKRILLDIGGDWCQYCHQMDQLFRDNPKLLELRDRNFITVAIYYGSENKNQQFLSHYSKVLGIPHFFVLEKDGTLLFSQHVRDLRSGGKYDPEKMEEFLVKWSLPNSEKTAKTGETTSAQALHR